MYKLTITEGQIEQTTIYFDKSEAESAKQQYLGGLSERDRDNVECSLTETTMEAVVADLRNSQMDDFEIWSALGNMVDGHAELERKAAAYDKMNAGSVKGGKRAWANLTPEQRSERAKKAVEARIKKYGQQRRTRD